MPGENELIEKINQRKTLDVLFISLKWTFNQNLDSGDWARYLMKNRNYPGWLDII